jgi:hypothetical protein
VTISKLIENGVTKLRRKTWGFAEYIEIEHGRFCTKFTSSVNSPDWSLSYESIVADDWEEWFVPEVLEIPQWDQIKDSMDTCKYIVFNGCKFKKVDD